jgi:hypothetical protein
MTKYNFKNIEGINIDEKSKKEILDFMNKYQIKEANYIFE